MAGVDGITALIGQEYGDDEGNTEKVMIREYTGSTDDLEMALSWHRHLLKKGVKSVPSLVKAKNGDTILKYEKKSYYAIANPGGKPFAAENSKHLLAAVEELARIHHCAAGFPADAVKKDSDGELRSLQMKLLDLIRYAYILRGGRLKNDFERIVSETVDSQYDQGQEALQQIAVHGGFGMGGSIAPLAPDFRQAGLVMLQEHPVFLNPLQGYCGSLTMDLVHFINSYLPLFNWKSELLKEIVQAYESIKPLGRGEKQLLKALPAFPGRYWLYAGQYFRGEKSAEQLMINMKNYLADQQRRERCLAEPASWLEGND